VTPRPNPGTISQEFLRDCIRDEREENSSISNSWHVKLSDLLVSRHANTYHAALDCWLTVLRDNIVLIQWCADWYDELQFFTDAHGPLHAMLEPRRGKLPSYKLMHSQQVVCLNNQIHFNVPMAQQLIHLRNTLLTTQRPFLLSAQTRVRLVFWDKSTALEASVKK